MRDTFAKVFQSHLGLKPGILVTGDLGYGVFDEIAEKYPASFLNAGITEQSLTSMCAGLADEGYIPFIYSIANFPTFRNLEQIRNDIAYPNKHVVITSVGAGLAYGTLGFSHFGVEDISIIRSLPNIRILSPSDPLRTRLASDSAFEIASPTYLRLGKNGEMDFGDTSQIKHNPVRQVFSAQSDTVVFSTGSIGARVDAVHGKTHNEFDHYSIEELWPPSQDMWDTLRNYSKVVVVEEHSPVGGLFSILAEGCMERSLRINLISCSVDRSRLFRAGNHQFMLDEAGLSTERIATTISGIQRH